MIHLIIIIECIIASGFIGYTAGYHHGYDDGTLYQVRKRLDEIDNRYKND